MPIFFDTDFLNALNYSEKREGRCTSRDALLFLNWSRVTSVFSSCDSIQQKRSSAFYEIANSYELALIPSCC